MPKSKRDKKISLTKTERKGLEWKKQIIQDIIGCIEKYPNIFIFSVENMRNNLLKEIRAEWRQHSRLIFAKNRIMKLGLTTSISEDNPNKGLEELSENIQGKCGLLFTQQTKDQVLEWSNNYSAVEYARSGFIANETVILPEGPLEEFTHSIEPHLRALGLPTKLHKGIIHLIKEHKVCTEGKALTPEEARILKLFARPMATFKVIIKCFWSADNGFESFQQADSDADNDEDEEKMDEDDSDDTDVK